MGVQDYLLDSLHLQPVCAVPRLLGLHQVRRLSSSLCIVCPDSNNLFRAQISLERCTPGSPKRSKRLRQSIFLCLACVCVSTAIVIMEAYVIMALQFCDGEDLISLYWSTWTMVQVGSLIAMVGIILAQAHSLRNRRHP